MSEHVQHLQLLKQILPLTNCDSLNLFTILLQHTQVWLVMGKGSYIKSS